MVIKKINENDLPGPYVEIAGVSWASCNLGATKPHECGSYYRWGSIKPNGKFDWENTPFNNGSKDYNKIYFDSVKDTICPNGVLAPEYDAIYQSTNGVARMPTQEEFQSLYDNTIQEVCDCTYMSRDYTPHLVKGILFTSNEDDSKKIFIPFSGYCIDEGICYFGDHACFWSSSLFLNAHCSYTLYCYGDGCVKPDFYANRYCGFTLRGVKN